MPGRAKMLATLLPRNEGIVDRATRVAVGIIIVLLGLFALGGVAGSVAGTVVAAAGLLPLVTGATGRCPSYVPFRFSTVGGPHRVSPTPADGVGPDMDRELASAGSVRRYGG
jgi:hypothetical protein